jgi:hypothetical protein
MQPPVRGREGRSPYKDGCQSEGSQESNRAQGQEFLSKACPPHRQSQDQQVDPDHHHQSNATERDAPAGQGGEGLNHSNGKGNKRPCME